jgi:hypothetical protein
MDTAGLIVLPRAGDPLDADLREVDVAIALVAQGAAIQVRLVGLHAPDEAAPIALARAQRAGVGFRLDHWAKTHLTFGPRRTRL